MLEVSGMRGYWKTMWVEGYRYAPDEDQRMSVGDVGPGFFAATGIPLLAGRDFASHDRLGTAPVAIINQAMAAKYFPHESPLGSLLGEGPGPAAGRSTYEVIGVVGNARHAGLRRAPRPMVFHPLAQDAQVRPFVLHVRTLGRPASLVAAVREAVRTADPRLVIANVRTMDEQTMAELRQERMFAGLSTLFALLGVCLSCVGLYGVTAQTVERRTREIGIRVALGAGRVGIVVLMLRETLTTVIVGIAIGGFAVVACRPLARGLVFGVAPTSAGAIFAAAAALAFAATAAAVVPARHASGIDPATALRCE
jgi:predicted permease